MKTLRIKSIGKSIVWLLLLLIIYQLCGALLPYVKGKNVSDGFKNNFNTSKFYSTGSSEQATYGVDRASIVETSKDALYSRLYMLEQAEERIILSTFSMKTDRSSKEIFSVIYAAAERGVKVLLLGDAISCGLDMNNDIMYYALASHPNIEIRFYNPIDITRPWTYNSRLHDKYIIVDDSMLLLGGRNTSDYFLGTYNPNVLSYDRDIFVYNTAPNNSSSVLKETQEYFYSIWNSNNVSTVFTKPNHSQRMQLSQAIEEYPNIYLNLKTSYPSLFETKDYITTTVPTKKITLIHNPTNLNEKEPWVWYQLAELMKQAKKRVVIQSPYAVLNKTMYETLEAVSAQVPDTTLFINSVAGGDNIVASSDYLFNKDKILATNFTIYEFQGKHSMHNKSLLIDDDISVIGSYNLDLRSTYQSTETMLVVQGTEFNQLLEHNIALMQEQSLKVNTNGSYEESTLISPISLTGKKKFLFSFTPYIAQLFRFMI